MSAAPKHAPRRARDAYYTPDRLARACVGVLPIEDGATVLEPSCGGGAFVRALTDVGAWVEGLDVDRDAAGLGLASSSAVRDFLTYAPAWRPSWVVGNPPYSAAEAHVRRALAVSRRHVAMLLRLSFLESARRAALWSQSPPRRVWVLTSRPSFTGGGTDSAAYGWFWWDRAWPGPTSLGWLDWARDGVQLSLLGGP